VRIVRELRQLLGVPGEFEALDGEPAGIVLERSQGAVVRPAADGIVTDASKRAASATRMMVISPL
jgi:hypothetical protein